MNKKHTPALNAPELLEALEILEAFIEDEFGGKDGMSAEYHCHDLVKARTAIAKAKGETP